MLNAAFWKIDSSDRAVSAWQQLGKGKATPENRVLFRFHTGSVGFGRSRRAVVGQFLPLAPTHVRSPERLVRLRNLPDAQG